MSAEVIGEAQVLIEATFADFDETVQRRLVTAARKAGAAAEKELKRSGDRAGKEFSEGVSKAAGSSKTLDSIRSSVERLERAAARAGDTQADAAGRVRVAEEALAAVKLKAVKDTVRIAAAEERLAKARRDSVRADNLAAAAGRALQGARSRLVAQGSQIGQDTGKAFIDGIERGAGRGGGAGRAGETAGGFFSRAFQGVVDRTLGVTLFRRLTVGKAIAGTLVVALSPLATLLGGASAATVALAGALSQAAGAGLALGGVLGSLGLAAATLKVGFAGLSDAMDAQAKAQQELAETGEISEATQKKLDAALKGLAPSARAVVLQLGKMAPAWKAVQQAVQEKLFTNMAKTLSDLGNRFLPLLTNQLGTAATTLNQTAVGVGGFLASWRGSKQINEIFTGLNGILRTLLAPVLTLTKGFLTIFTASLPFAQRLADALSRIGTEFGTWLTKVSESGAFNQFMETAFTLAGDLFGLLGNIGSIIGTVFAAGSETGGSLLIILRDLTEKAAEFLKSAEGQKALASFFDLVAAAGRILVGVFTTLKPLLDGISAVFDALEPAVAALGAALQPVVRALSAQLGASLSQLAPLFANLVTALAPLGVALGDILISVIQQLTPVIASLVTGLLALAPGVTAVVTAIGSFLVGALSTLGPLLSQILVTAGQFLSQFLVGAVPVIQVLGNALLQLAGPLVQLGLGFLQALQALIPLLPSLGQLNAAVLKLVVAFLPLVTTILQIFADQLIASLPTLTAMVPVLLRMILALTDLAVKILPVVAGFVTFASIIIRAIAAIDLAIIGFVGKVIGNIVRLFVRIVALAIAGGAALRRNIGTAIAAVVTLFGGLVTSVTTKMSQFASTISSGVQKAVTFFRELPGKIKAALSGIGTALFSAGQDAVQGLINGITSKAGQVASAAQDLAAKVKAGIGGALKIFSPSRVTREQGEFIGEGLAQGILAKIREVQEAAARLANAIPPVFAVTPQVETAAAQVTQAASSAVFDQGLLFADGVVAGLQRQQVALDTEMIRLADVFVGRVLQVLRELKLTGLGTLNIPGFANGGVQSRESLIRVAEKDRAEAIIPLTKPRRAQSIMDATGLSALAQGNSGKSSRTVEVPINVAGSVVDYAALTAHIRRVLQEFGFRPSLGLATAGGGL